MKQGTWRPAPSIKDELTVMQEIISFHFDQVDPFRETHQMDWL